MVRAQSSEPLGPVPIVNLAEEDAERISLERPCVKTYPWPNGLFFTDQDTDRAITSGEMRELRVRVEDLVRSYEAGELSYLDGLGDELVITMLADDQILLSFYASASSGWNLELLLMYGYFLEAQVLLREGQLDEAESIVRQAIGRFDAQPASNAWDILDDATYFSEQSLNNLLVLLLHKIRAETGSETLDASLKSVESFALVRQELRYEINLIGDPMESLLWNSGCL